MVFQHFHLFPHKIVPEKRMLAPMTVKGKTKEEIQPLARQRLNDVGLSEKADESPSKLP